MHAPFRPYAAILVLLAWQAQACVMDPALDEEELASLEAELGAEPGWEAEPGEGPVATAGCGDGICSADETDENCAADCGCSASADLCGSFTPAPIGCWCDADCASVGDCCADVGVCELSQAPDNGQGAPCEHGEKDAGFFDWIRLDFYRSKYKAAAEVGGLLGSEEARTYLLHFLGNSGDQLEVDVDKMLSEIPSFQDEVNDERIEFAEGAAAKGESMSRTSVSEPVPDDWDAASTNSGESFNWYFALGSWDYNQSGTVTVEKSGDQWEYSVKTKVHVSKHYDWDPNKKVGPGGIFDQSELAELHCYGWAQEFWIKGESSTSLIAGVTP